jgi:hypothetical protein
VFNNVFPKIVPLRENVEKYGTAEQAKDDKMAKAYCLLDTLGSRHKLRIYNSYWNDKKHI